MSSTTIGPANRTLARRIRRRIATRGPITFAEFMDAALYDSEEGFYAHLPVGEVGDFVTSPHISTVFGRLLARQIGEFWDSLGRAKAFPIIEVGAGDGTLAHQILDFLADEARVSARYATVDRSAAARAALQTRGLGSVETIDALPTEMIGCIIANELLDNLPFHRIRQTAAGPAELLVGLEENRFVLVEGAISSPSVAALVPAAMQPGDEAAVSPATLDFLQRAAAHLDRGYLLLIDYGWISGARRDLVHGYRGQRSSEEVLEDPGSRDITAGVDFGLLARWARTHGLATWGPVLQRDALLALGYREWDREAQHRQVDAVGARRGVEALRLYSDRNRANLLLGRTGLGAFYFLCMGVGVTTPPTFARPL
jgi:SAM-dependent MidA family methyltransferase